MRLFWRNPLDCILQIKFKSYILELKKSDGVQPEKAVNESILNIQQ